jgi:hypothetical protein
MAAAPKLYTRLPGRGIRRAIFAVAATRCGLWLGPDHLLAVDATTASEEYRRFYFRDIEAFVIRRTRGRASSNWILLVLALVTVGPLLVFWRTEGSTGWMVGALVLGAFWAALALLNTLRGATCETKIRTAVQLEHLPSLNRLPVARRVLARIVPIITDAQGAATPDELYSAPWMSADSARHPALLRHEKGHLHYGLFALLLTDAVSTAIAYGVSHGAVAASVAISTVATLLGFVLCIFALIRQGDSDLPDAVRLITRSALALYILSFGAGFTFSIIYAVRHPGQQVQTGLEIINEPGFQTIAMISAGLAAVIGVAGIVAMRAPRRTNPTA